MHIYAQIVDDTLSHTLVAASTMEKDIASSLSNTSNTEAAAAVGLAIAKKAIAAGITQVVFDRGGYLYHGKVKALADAAREGGLVF
jgi:large subunit ribosomal protein L18